MKPAHLILVAALVGVGGLLYLALDPDSGHGGQRGEGAAGESSGTKREAAQVTGSDHGAQPEGTADVFIQVHPAGVADVILTGPRNWRGRTNEEGSAFAGWMTPGRYAVSAHRDALTAAKTFTVEERTTVELRLDESIAVRGHVFDAAGRGIAGAVVQATPESERTGVHPGWRLSWLAANARPPIYAEATTNETGAYTLQVRAAAYTLEARARGFAGMNEPARAYDKATDGIDFHLQPGAEVAGRVVDSAGQPVADALVVVTGGRSLNTLAYSDADGAFRLDVPVSGWSQLSVRAHGYAPAMFGSVHPPVAGLVVRIDRGATARAKLVVAKSGGQPAVGVEAYLSFNGGGRTAISDDGGGVELALVSTQGSTMSWMNLMFAGGGFVPAMHSVNGKQVVDGVVYLGEFELKPGATIRGRVTDEASGAGIEGADVRWFSGSLRGFARSPVTGATSGADGRFELTGVAEDTVAVIAIKAGYANPMDRAAIWQRMRDKQAHLLAPGQMLLEHDVVLVRAMGVSGIALDPAGKPLAGVVVRGPTANAMTGDATRPSAITGADGRFELGGFRNGFKLSLDARHARYGSASPVRLTVGDGSEATIQFDQPVRVVGRVVGPDDKPVVGASVVANKPPKRGQRQFERNPPQGTTDADGRFVLRTVPAQKRQLQVMHTRFLIHKEDISLSPDQESHDVGELRLEHGPGIEGRLVDEQKQPIAGATITLSWSEQKRPVAGPGERLYARLSTGPDGRFAAYGLKQGNYRINPDVNGLFCDRPVTPTGTKDIVVVLRNGKAWHGRIVAAGEPVQGAFVSAKLTSGRGWIAGGMSGKDGAISLEPLPPDGVFDLEVQHQDYKPLKMANVTVATLSNQIPIEPGAVIRGVVVDTDGKPVVQAHLQARPLEGKGFKWAQTKEDGSFVLSGLDEQKRYSIKVSWTSDQHVPGDAIEAQPGEEEIRFELAKGYSISGRIKTRNPDELGNIRVVAIDSQGKQRATAWVYAARQLDFKLNSLRVGTYTLRVLSGWGANEETLAELAGAEAGATDLEITADG